MKGLNLKKAAVVPRETQEQIGQNAFDILEEVQIRMRKLGIPDVPKPDDMPPSLGNVDVGSVPNREIESLYTKYLAYASYLAPRVAEIVSSYKISTANLKRVAADIKLQLVRDSMPREELSAAILGHPVYIEQELEHLKLFAMKEIIGSYYKSYSKQASALSRIIEIRKLEQEQEQRGHRIGTTRRPGVPSRGFSRG